MRKLIPVAAAIAALAVPAVAQARPPLDLDRAADVVLTKAETQSANDNRAAAEFNADLPSAQEIAAWAAEGFDPAIFSRQPFVTSTTLAEACDAETRYRALCDVDYNYDDGSTDTETAEVYVTSRGVYRVRGL